MLKQLELIVLIVVIAIGRCNPNDFIEKYDIQLVDMNDSRLKVHNIDGDRVMTNMKPILINEQIQFMDDENYQKYLRGASIELRRKKIWKGIFWDTKYKCYEDKTYRQFKSKTDKQNIFRRGKCLPVIVIPGLMATRLKVNVDCSQVDRSISNECSNMCSKYYDGNKAQRFQAGVIWLNLLDGIGKILKSQNNFCFGKLFEMSTSMEMPQDKIHLSNLKGIQVVVDDYGNSKTGQCGKTAIEHIDGEMYYNPLETYLIDLKGFSKMFDYFESEMGYENGVNYFSIPYDFRQSMGEDDLINNFKRTLEWSFKINKKKALIVCHSLGGIQTVYNLAQLDQEFKDKYIERVVTIGSPQSGSINMNLIWQGIKTSYQIEFMGYGLGVNDYRSMVLTMPIFREVMVSYSFMDQQWYKYIIERHKIEQLYKESKTRQLSIKEQQELNEYMTETSKLSKSFNFFPFPWDYDNYDPNLGLNILDYGVTPILQTKEKNYTATFEDQKAMLIKNSLRYTNDEDQKVTEHRIDRVLHLLKKLQDVRNIHPNVPLTTIYSSQFDTLSGYATSDDEPNPISVHSQNLLYDKGKFLYHKGDQSIEITQVLLRPLKWAYDFEQNRENSKYPIEIINIGPTIGPHLDPKQSYQNDNSKNRYRQMKGNGYSHSQLTQDPNIISLIEQMIMNGENIQSLKDIPSFESEFIQSEKCLSKMKDLCVNLYGQREFNSSEQLMQFLYDSLDKDYLINPRETHFKSS